MVEPHGAGDLSWTLSLEVKAEDLELSRGECGFGCGHDSVMKAGGHCTPIEAFSQLVLEGSMLFSCVDQSFTEEGACVRTWDQTTVIHYLPADESAQLFGDLCFNVVLRILNVRINSHLDCPLMRMRALQS